MRKVEESWNLNLNLKGTLLSPIYGINAVESTIRRQCDRNRQLVFATVHDFKAPQLNSTQKEDHSKQRERRQKSVL